MKFKIWLNIITFIALGLVIYFAWGDITHAFAYMTTLNLWVLLLIIPVQLFAFFALGKIFQHFFKVMNVHLTMRQLFAPIIELNFVNHIFPSGGASGFSYLTLRLRQYNVSTAKSTLAQLARFVFTFLVYIGMMFVALFALALQGGVNSLVIFAVTGIAFTVLFGTGVLIFVAGRQSRIDAFTKTTTMWLNKCIHVFRRKHPETIRLARVRLVFTELHEDYVVVRQNLRRIWPVILWAILANLAEAALLYIAFSAHGMWVNPGVVLIALVVASMVGLIAIIPGGVGMYEPVMAAVLISGGIPAAVAFSATLVYRVISLLTSLLTGYFLYQRAINRYGQDRLTG